MSTVMMAVIFGMATTVTAWAQGVPTGTLVGHLAWCKIAPRPMGQSDGEPSPLADVTPGMGHRPVSVASIRVPAADVQVALMGTGLSATTDANGGFTLNGVPAAQALTLVASAASGPLLVLDGPSLVVTAGQTRDLGSVGLVGCDDSGLVLTVAPRPAADDGPAATVPEQPAPAPETDPAAQQPDAGPMTDGSN